MKTLLWKEYRQNLRFLTGAVLVLLMPYLVCTSFSLVYSRHRSSHIVWEGLMDAISTASGISLVLSFLVTGFIAANMLTGERADRSAEFVTYLPISRRSALLSKLIYAIPVSLLLILFNFSVLYFLTPRGDRHALVFIYLGSTSAIIMTFGISWLLASFMRSPTIPAIAGFAMVICTIVTVRTMIDFEIHDNRLEIDVVQKLERLWFWSSCGIGLITGSLSFIAGCICYLRRVEP